MSTPLSPLSAFLRRNKAPYKMFSDLRQDGTRRVKWYGSGLPESQPVAAQWAKQFRKLAKAQLGERLVSMSTCYPDYRADSVVLVYKI